MDESEAKKIREAAATAALEAYLATIRRGCAGTSKEQLRALFDKVGHRRLAVLLNEDQVPIACVSATFVFSTDEATIGVVLASTSARA